VTQVDSSSCVPSPSKGSGRPGSARLLKSYCGRVSSSPPRRSRCRATIEAARTSLDGIAEVVPSDSVTQRRLKDCSLDVSLDSRCSSSIEVDWVADRLFDTKLLFPLSPRSGSAPLAAMKSPGECVGRAITDEAGDFREALFATAQMVTRECHPPIREVLHRGPSQRLAERACEGRAGHAAEFGQFGNRP
jgi:hypothetical protein